MITWDVRLMFAGVILSALASYGFIMYDLGYDAADAHHTKQANTAWVQRFTLESQLATRDAQLAEAQQAASKDRQKTVTVREVIYRDRIKVRTVRDCVADSGLFELYNSTLGVTGGQQ